MTKSNFDYYRLAIKKTIEGINGQTQSVPVSSHILADLKSQSRVLMVRTSKKDATGRLLYGRPIFI